MTCRKRTKRQLEDDMLPSQMHDAILTVDSLMIFGFLNILIHMVSNIFSCTPGILSLLCKGKRWEGGGLLLFR